jgi:hypothetical protein
MYALRAMAHLENCFTPIVKSFIEMSSHKTLQHMSPLAIRMSMYFFP